MKIEYYKKNVYGNEHIYIKDKEISAIVHQLTAKKTINEADITALEALGHEFVQVLP